MVFILILQITSSAVNGVEIDMSQIGVNDGDTFTFVLKEYREQSDFFDLEEDEDDTKYHVGAGLDISEGDEFTLTVISATLEAHIFTPDPSIIESYTLAVKYNSGNQQAFDDLSLFVVWDGAHLGGYIVFTDWNFYEELAQNDSESFEPDLEGDFYSYNIENNDDEFILSGELNQGGTTTNFDLRYDKTTGVLLYDSIQVSSDFSNGTNYYTRSEVLTRKGYLEDDNNKIRFKGYTVVLGIFVLIPLINKKRKLA